MQKEKEMCRLDWIQYYMFYVRYKKKKHELETVLQYF